MAEPSALVVGGGLAGIAAALRLADGGRTVALVEKRPRLGGAAFSSNRGALSIDNGQHVFLRCCEAYRWLLHRINADDSVVLQRHLDIPVLGGDGRSARLTRTPGLPAPFHLTAALARYRLLGPADRLRVARGALALRRLHPADIRLDTQTLGAFLRRHGQNEATIRSLWGVVATATLNQDPDRASLALAAKVFRTGLLDRADAGDVGYARVPLGDVHSTAALLALENSGVQVALGEHVTNVEPGGVVSTEGSAGRRDWHPDSVVLAVPHHAVFGLAPALLDTSVAAARDLGSTPIVNVHVVYDRKVTDLPFAAAVDSPVQWFFDRTGPSGLQRTRPAGQYLAVTVSDAHEIIDTPTRALRERFVAALSRLLPAAARAEVVDAFVTRERRATFAQVAGSVARRPGRDSALAGLWLAGSWTDTGWPDTMEGAVRSGISAAEAVLAVTEKQALGFAA